MRRLLSKYISLTAQIVFGRVRDSAPFRNYSNFQRDIQSIKSFSTFSNGRSRNIGSGSSSRVVTASSTDDQQEAPLTVGGLAKAKPLLVGRGSSEGPKLVLKLLESTGFPQTGIKRIVSLVPEILSYDSNKCLKPKIDFLRSVGLSETDVVKMITSHPPLLNRNLKNHIIPLFDFLRTLLGGEQCAVYFIKRHPLIFKYNVSDNMAPNLSALQDIGFRNIKKLMSISRFTRVLGEVKPSRFNKIVNEVMDIGFDSSLSHFISAIIAMASHTEKTWEKKLKFYGSLGFSDQEVLSMFKKQPTSMEISKEKIRAAVQFFTKKFHWSPTQISARPGILLYNLEKRVIPRCSVLQALVARNKVRKNVSVLSLVCISDKDFEDKYVTKYMEEVPEVVDAYQENIGIDCSNHLL
ncbi:uncharacterized protein LOC127807775 isoform X2 [Diospyros lotus]|uniref:uncharacterized protein LOC127807775 isoform X2 n=1 Tax=Diospyros lotus TaxID=55363 RepID=UPI00225403C4|nr:uncharacterized protein LOC127807775 isoform X2 [Diospyros lotus]